MEIGEILKKLTSFNVKDNYYKDEEKKELVKMFEELLFVDERNVRDFLETFFEQTKALASASGLLPDEEEEYEDDEEDSGEETPEGDEGESGDEEAPEEAGDEEAEEEEEEKPKKEESVEISKNPLLERKETYRRDANRFLI